MKKKILVGKVGFRSLFVDVKIDDENNVSICGNVGNQSFGQIREQLLDITELAEGWTIAKVTKLHQIWKDWHLNNLVAGSPRQRAWIAETGIENYKNILEQMPEHILTDETYLHNGKPYKYGSAWLRVDVPDDVLQWLRSL